MTETKQMSLDLNYPTEQPKLVKRFFEYHKANPEIYRKFKHYAFELFTAKPTRRIGAQIIIERLRYDVYLNPDRLDDEFKLPNEFGPAYARMFMDDHSRYNGLITIRTSIFDDYFECTKNKNNE